MDIEHLQYFVEIVNSELNLSAASRKLCISQPALSAIIRNFEGEERTSLFERYNGRLQALTPSGEIFYKNAVLITENYQNMIHELRESSRHYKGKIKIGIPPLILGVSFAELLPRMILENPDIEFEIIEMGAYELKNMLTSKNLNFAVLLDPIEVCPGSTEKHTLIRSELTAYMCEDHPLAQNERIRWQDLDQMPMAIFNSTFMINHHLLDKFRTQGVAPDIRITSSCWDYLLLSTKNTDLITVLPAPTRGLVPVAGTVERPFDDPIPWTVVLHQPKKPRYNHLEKHVLTSIVNYFHPPQG